MKLSSIVSQINTLSDESETFTDVVNWINDAIAKINIHLDANFPFMDASLPDSEPVFPEKWQRILLIPFGVGRVKQRDSSQFEYSDAYNEFLANLDDMRAKYTVPDEYKDADSSVGHSSDIFEKPPIASWMGEW